MRIIHRTDVLLPRLSVCISRVYTTHKHTRTRILKHTVGTKRPEFDHSPSNDFTFTFTLVKW